MNVVGIMRLLEDYPEAYGTVGTISFYEKCFEAMDATYVSVTDNKDRHVALIEWRNGPSLTEAEAFMKQWKVAHIMFDLVRTKTVTETVKV